jgi:chaperonin GroES
LTKSALPIAALQLPKEENMKFKPLHDRVAVRRIEQEEKTAGGILIPDTAKEKPMQGEVVAVGKGKRLEDGRLTEMGVAVGPGERKEDGRLHPLDVKPGNRVLFGKWSGTEVRIDDEELLILKESDIMGVIEGAAAKTKAAP